MTRPILILGEALMDCLAQPDGSLLPLMGGSPYNLARAAARQGAQVGYLPPFSTDRFGQQLKAQAASDGVQAQSPDSPCPTSLAVVTVQHGQASYSFYREGIADRDHTPAELIALLRRHAPGVLHTGSLMLLPPEQEKTLQVLRAARDLGWRISVDTNLRPAMARDLPAYREAVMQAVALADWVKASDEDLLALGLGEATPANAEQVLHAFARPANRHIAFTFGAAGACLWVSGTHARGPAPAVKVVDTVGAGDTFWGTCLAEWARNESQAAAALPVTLARALRAAAINCERKGCQPPTREELDLETVM